MTSWTPLHGGRRRRRYDALAGLIWLGVLAVDVAILFGIIWWVR